MIAPELEQLSLVDAQLVGGKAACLGEIAAAGLAVPRGFVVPMAYSSILRPDVVSTSHGDKNNDEIQLPDAFSNGVLAAFDALDAELVCVRSSANCEDAVDISFAGIFESFLAVRRDNVLARIIDCWNSRFSKRALSYYERSGIEQSTVQMGVIIQTLVPAQASGVCFTDSPLDSDGAAYVEAISGLGEGLAGGLITPDGYSINKSTYEVRLISRATQDTAFGLVNGALAEIPISPAADTGVTLTSDQAIQVVQGALRLAEWFHKPQDVEFAIHDGTVYFLQSRPITTASGY